MGSDVEQSGPQEFTGVIFTVQEAQLLNGLLNSAGFKGSEGKRIAAAAQEKVEMFLPPGSDDD